MWSLLYISLLAVANAAAPIVPAIFAFGDSLVDTGCTYLSHPYGIDFPNLPYRFSNGRLVIDVIANNLGLPSPPSYFYAGTNISRGVNLASTGAGLLDSLNGSFSLSRQVDHFQSVQNRLQLQVGYGAARTIISNSILFICIGNNDVDNYFRKHQTPLPDDIETSLISNYSSQIQRLYRLGGRKFALVGLSAVGCLPVNLRRGGRCAEPAQKSTQRFNAALQAMVSELRSTVEDIHVVVADFYRLMIEVHDNPHLYHFDDVTTACCPEGSITFGCEPSSKVCPDRSKFAYWDAVHNTDAFNVLAGNLWTYSNDQKMVNPINILDLARLS